MSGYQVTTTNFFASNSASVSLQSAVNLLQDSYLQQSEQTLALGSSTSGNITVEQITLGYIKVTGSAGSAITLSLPAAADVFDALNNKVYSMGALQVNPVTITGQANPREIGLHNGASVRLTIYNTTGQTITISSGDANFQVNNAGNSITTLDVGSALIVVVDEDAKKLALTKM
jgi:hypothetical protein